MSDATPSAVGWYPDPDDATGLRWWSGRDWTEYRQSAGQPPTPTVAVPVVTAPRPAGPARKARATPGRVVMAVVVLLVLLVGGASSGIGGLLMSAGLIALLVGVIALIKGRNRLFLVGSRGVGALVLVGGLVATFGGSGAYAATHPELASQSRPEPIPVATSSSPEAAASPAAASTETPTSTPTAVPRPAPRSALAVLATLAVKGRAPMTGYARTADFGTAWLDVNRNGCDTRNDILRRDLVDTSGSGCRVLTGTLEDPYTGTEIHFVRGEVTSMAVQIDHVVALGDAWQTGAQKLSQAQRVDLANDPINLFAVDGPTNEQKGDGDAATWLPPTKSFRCTYVAHQVGVKKAYGLWVTPAEKAAMQRVLSTCPTVKAATSTVSHVVLTVAKAKPKVAHSAPPKPKPVAKPKPVSHPDLGVVHPGAFCAPEGATGHTTRGTPMTCKTSSTDSRARWRSAY